MSAIRIGTRRSTLALVQARLVADALSARGHDTELVEVTTEGDRNHAPLARIGGLGVFVGALRNALRRAEVDVAVHSLKDLPSTPEPDIALAAVPPREDPRDALVARDGLALAELPSGARIGTGSPRRLALLRAVGKDLDLVEIRGNVDTRIRKVRDGELDAVVLARAGLARLGRLDEVTETFDPREFVPAPGQGALGVECRANDLSLAAALAGLDDPSTRAAVTAERAVLATLGAGCSAPVGAFARALPVGGGGEDLSLQAVVIAVDGSFSVRLSASGSFGEAAELGRRVATEMLAEGASRLIEERVT